jgi:hypothetical protein
MSITNNSTLLTAIDAWLARSDLTSYTPTFVQLAEQRIYHGSDDPEYPADPLRVREMETEIDYTITGAAVATPDGFLEAKRLYLNDNTDQSPLAMVSPEQLKTDYPLGATGRPQAFTVVGSEIQFGPTPDTTYSAKLLYYKKPDPLATTTTNAILTAYPAVYLYAALLEAHPFMKDDGRIPLWARKYAAAVGGVMKSSKASRWSGSIRVVRTDVGNP